MNTPARTSRSAERRVSKIVIKGRAISRPAVKGDNGSTVYMERRRSEKAEFRFMCALLIHWGRGFSLEDAPPALNEWTRGRPLW